MRDYLMGEEMLALRKSVVNVEKLASLTASRRAAWECGALTLGRDLELRHLPIMAKLQ